ncbi:transposase [Lysinibacillus fusiformis]|uniref:IS3 family transposase n=1 Tax=Lysinibacillus TaxID=400634 RepID=UPI000506FB58|nr:MULTISPECIES: IS3 family transposase [Lysinibacillus]KAB0443613.1 IS3 family transposase [Lysinibacillus fusiformis]KGA81066.1 transposase [Lysinibacillus fusiformis]MCE4044391.1 IS3 family transposase [Lysinibacillus fusiformis]
MSSQPRTFASEFKLQLVKFWKNRKFRADIAREYDITLSALDRWIKNHQETGSFAAKDNRSEEDNELARLRKESQRLLMENDILKQAALIMGRK